MNNARAKFLFRQISISLFVAVVGSVACSSPEEPAPLIGTWALSTINGKSLPFPSTVADIISGSITIDAAGTFTEVENLSSELYGSGSISNTGHYVIAGDGIMFGYDSGRQSAIGETTGNRLTMSFGGGALVKTYKR